MKLPATEGDHNIQFISDIYNIMSQGNILLTYLGDVTPEITNALLMSLKHSNPTLNEDIMLKKKVYKIIVECLENIYRHAEEVMEKKLHPSIFVLSKQENNYYIATGNYIYTTGAEAIKSTIDEINRLDKEGMKERYRERLATGDLSAKGGAGLGMIDIAIKSENKLEYEFIPIESSICFYILKVKV